MLDYDYRDEQHHHHFLGTLGTVAFVAGAATRPRGMATFFFFAGLICFVVGIVWGLTDSYMLASFWILALFAWGFALITRVIGWTAGVALDAAQDVIHDRYDRHHDQSDFKFDPYTGQPLVHHGRPFSRWRDAHGNLLPPDQVE